MGAWNVAQVSTEGRELEWAVDGTVDGPGQYEAAFVYYGGGKAAEVGWAALMQGEVEVTRDEHVGTSGSAPEGHVYRLTVPEGGGPGGYLLRAFIRGKGGIDSNGLVFVRRVAGAASWEPVRAN